MLKQLIKKQFRESFRGYFVNNKTNKLKTKKDIIKTFMLLAFILLIFGVCFYGISETLSDLLMSNSSWLYFSILGLAVIGLGTFTSMFSAASFLYDSKDNNLLLSMPIKKSSILISRIALVYGLSFLYSFTGWVGVCIRYYQSNGINVYLIFCQILIFLFITLLTTIFSCILGFIVSKIQRRFKKGNLLTTFFSLIFFGVYYYFWMSFTDLLKNIVLNADKISEVFKKIYILFLLGSGCLGNFKNLLFFIFIVSFFGIIIYLILSKNYIQYLLRSDNIKTKNKKIKFKKQKKVSIALLCKEFTRLLSSTTYILNSCLPIIFIFFITGYLLIKKDVIIDGLFVIQNELPFIDSCKGLILLCLFSSLTAGICTTTPSISLEGNTFWLIKALPVSIINFLYAKKNVQFLLCFIPSILCFYVIGFCFNLGLMKIILTSILLMLVINMQSYIGLLFGLKNPMFNWTSEAQPIKQNIDVFLALMVNIFCSLLVGVVYLFFINILNENSYMLIMIIIVLMISMWLDWKLKTWGVKKIKSC